MRDCRAEPARGSGPGGQKKNKTWSGVRLIHDPTGIAVTACEDRSREVNRKKALGRLRYRLALTYNAARERDQFTLPDDWGDYVDGGRLLPGKKDKRGRAYAAHFIMTAHRLCRGRVRDAASLLGTGSSAFTRLIREMSPLQRQISQERQQSGLPPLRG